MEADPARQGIPGGWVIKRLGSDGKLGVGLANPQGVRPGPLGYGTDEPQIFATKPNRAECPAARGHAADRRRQTRRGWPRRGGHQKKK